MPRKNDLAGLNAVLGFIVFCVWFTIIVVCSGVVYLIHQALNG